MNPPLNGYRDRADAAQYLVDALRERPLVQPLVLAIPRGGVATGVVLARGLLAELDVVFARKLRAPGQPEYAIGAVSEKGLITLNPDVERVPGVTREYLDEETQLQLAEIARRKELVRAVRPMASCKGRSVIITDDGIATGSTMLAALQTVRAEHPREIIVAVPVAAPERLADIRQQCDDIICPLAPESFWAIGQFYENFDQVEDEEMLAMLMDNPSHITVPSPAHTAYAPLPHGE